MDLREVGQEREGGLVAQRNVDQAMMGQSAHGSDSGRLLTTAEGASRDEETGVLAPETALGPDAAGLVPPSLPLGGEVTVAGRDAEEEGIVLEQLLWLRNGVGGLGRSVHQGENIVGQGLRDPYPCLSAQKFLERVHLRPHTGRYRQSRQQPRYPSSRPRPASGCGRTWSTAGHKCESNIRHQGGR